MNPGAEVRRHVVTLPAALCEAVLARVGARGFSAYVAAAVARQIDRDTLADLLAAMEAERGPVVEAEVEAILQRLAR